MVAMVAGWQIFNYIHLSCHVYEIYLTFLVAQVLVFLQPAVGFLKSRQLQFLLRIKNFKSV